MNTARSLLLLAFLVLCLPCEAGYIIRIDLDRNDADIDSVLAAAPDQAIEGSVVIEVTPEAMGTPGGNLFGYSFDLRFRDSELDLGAASLGGRVRSDLGAFDVTVMPPIVLSPLSNMAQQESIENYGIMPRTDSTVGEYGEFINIDAGTVGSSALAPGAYTVFHFNLTAANPTGDASVVDIFPFMGPTDAFIDLNLDETAPVFFGASVVTAVPEPSSFALLGLGTVWFARRRRRKRA
ncbi:MAG: PEP-CTERM sorting domain-containing protein [Rubripirellula sp.]